MWFEKVNFILLLNISHFLTVYSEEYKLELLQVLFRHGDRMVSKRELYKADPYVSKYEEVGYEQMTKAGLKRAHRLGKALRQHYHDFLGEYRREDVYARSSDTDRTKMSLQLVLAGLYPPTNETRWSDEVAWLPIPYHYESRKIDFLRLSASCSRLEELLHEGLEEGFRELNLEKEFLDYVRNSTGVESTIQMARLYINLKCVLSYGLPLPSWCSESDYKLIEKIGETFFDSFSRTLTQKRITGGLVIEHFTKNIEEHEKHKGPKKIYLYSGHDHNVATFAAVHNFTNIRKGVDFSCAVVVEKLRGQDDRIYLRMHYYTGVTDQWIALKMQNCDYECPLRKYRNLVQWVLPDAESRAICSDENCDKS